VLPDQAASGSRGRLLAVTTGQQPRSSPAAHTVHKALSAIALAQDWSGKRVTVVPVFWVAGDHDFASQPRHRGWA